MTTLVAENTATKSKPIFSDRHPRLTAAFMKAAQNPRVERVVIMAEKAALTAAAGAITAAAPEAAPATAVGLRAAIRVAENQTHKAFDKARSKPPTV